MIAESLRNIVEIEGLKRKINELDNSTKAELKRLSDIEQKRIDTQNSIKDYEQKIHDLKLKEAELDILNLENKIEKLKSQTSMVKNEKEANILEKEISLLITEHKTKEDNYFKNLDFESQYQNNISDYKNFLEGSLETLNEIKKEVDEFSSKNNLEVSNLQKRINSLLENTTNTYSKVYLETSNRLKVAPTTAYINGKNCSVCKIAIDQLTITNVENHVSLEQCPNCGRILIPHNLY